MFAATRTLLSALSATAALAAGIAFAVATPAAAHDSEEADCADLFGFAQSPVPVAKTADGQEVLATVRWGYSPGLCYLTLDEPAIQVLRANPPTGPQQVTTPADGAAADRCHNAHNPQRGFARNQVPVAKSADGQQVLATVRWGYSPGLCYLTLDEPAVQVLRAEPTATPTPTSTATPTPTPTATSTAEPLSISASPPTRMDAGQFHSCYLQDDNTAICLNGNRFHGQALTGAPGGEFAAISSGYRHSCGLRPTGTVECWGDDQFGPFLAPAGQFAAVSAGASYSCGLRPAGTIECWGHQDGKGNPIPANDVRLRAPPGQFVSLSAATDYVCGLRTDSTVSCWGREWVRDRTLNAPSSHFTAVSTGLEHACGLQVDGTLECWGVTGPRWGKSDPPGGQFTAIALGSQHSCALRANGTVECWGKNNHGQADPPSDRFTEITAGGNTSCGFRADKTAVCWGAIKRPFEGAHNVHVFYCAAQSAGYSNADLQREVQALNDNVGAFFSGQSAGMATVNFVAGGVVSPDINWDRQKVSDLHTGGIYGDPCETAIDQLGDYQQLLILVNLEPGSPSGFAEIEGETGQAFSATLEARHSSSCSPLSASSRVRDLGDKSPCSVYQSYYYVIAHEIGHTVFRLDHDLDCSVMSYNCVDNSRLGCSHLILLGWPHEDQCERDQLWRVQSRTDFTFVQSGIQYYCGLRTDGTIACWGRWDYGQTNPPSGTFTAISVHYYHACGLRTDGTIPCWGRNNYGQTNAPSGTFTSVRTWRSHSCGVRDSGVTECWGDQTIGKQKSYTPGGQFTSISAGGVHWCGLRVDQTIVCDGFHDSPATHPPAGTFNYVHANFQYSCGLKSDQALVCWGESGMGQVDPPAGQFTSLDSGWHHACGLHPDQTITCWYYSSDVTRLQLDFGQDHAPSGQFTAIASGNLHACGLRVDKTITCWGHNGHEQTNSPSGQFMAIAAGGLTSCGLRTNQTIVCWGDNDKGQADPPNGQFTAIASTGIHSCALRPNKTVTCWGQNASGETDAPDGEFIAVTTGGQHSCGIRADRTTVVCWGVVPE